MLTTFVIGVDRIVVLNSYRLHGLSDRLAGGDGTQSIVPGASRTVNEDLELLSSATDGWPMLHAVVIRDIMYVEVVWLVSRMPRITERPFSIL